MRILWFLVYVGLPFLHIRVAWLHNTSTSLLSKLSNCSHVQSFGFWQVLCSQRLANPPTHISVDSRSTNVSGPYALDFRHYIISFGQPKNSHKLCCLQRVYRYLHIRAETPWCVVTVNLRSTAVMSPFTA